MSLHLTHKNPNKWTNKQKTYKQKQTNKNSDLKLWPFSSYGRSRYQPMKKDVICARLIRWRQKKRALLWSGKGRGLHLLLYFGFYLINCSPYNSSTPHVSKPWCDPGLVPPGGSSRESLCHWLIGNGALTDGREKMKAVTTGLLCYVISLTMLREETGWTRMLAHLLLTARRT